jgi:hypothetical protein
MLNKIKEPKRNELIIRPLIPFEVEMANPMITYKIKPDFNISNVDNEVIAHAINCMYLTPRQRLNIKKFSIMPIRKAYFDIIFRHNRVNFYFTINEDYSDLVVGKMKTIWNKAEISETLVSNVNSFNRKKTQVCEIVLRDYNFKSLNTNKNNLYPLTNMIGTTKLLKEGEQIRINIAIEPTSRINWINVAKDEFKSYKNGTTVDNSMSLQEKAIKLGFKGAEIGVQLYLEFKMLLFESVFGIVIPDKEEEKIPKFELKLDSLEAIIQQNQYYFDKYAKPFLIN